MTRAREAPFVIHTHPGPPESGVVRILGRGRKAVMRGRRSGLFKRWRLFLPALLVSLVFLCLACAGGAEDDSGGGFYSEPESIARDDSGAPTGSVSIAQSQPALGSTDSDDSASLADGEEAQREAYALTDVSVSGQIASVAPQARLIVRTVDMTIEVVNVATIMNSIGDVAAQYGGWIVSEQRSSRHTGWISIRVQSAQLDAAVRQVSALGLDVASLISTSTDVTEEFFDIQSRISNLEQTRTALQRLLELEGEIEDILEVQREITNVSEQIERLEGRRRYLEQTSATSLINVSLELAPVDMPADAGADIQVVEGRNISFRATFRPPDGIDSFVYNWDFGDGRQAQGLTRTDSTANEGERITQTVTHVYESVDESPYFVTFTIRGTGEAGAATAEDRLQASVSRVPTIQLSAPSGLTIRANDEAIFVGEFTRPPDIVNLRYEWDFGDGLTPALGDIEADQTTVEVAHTYSIDRGEPYLATFTVTGETSFGASIESSTTTQVYVEPGSQWVVGIVDVGETARGATRALSAFAQILLAVAIVAVVFSPVLIVVGGAVWILRRAGIWGRTVGRIGRPFKSPPQSSADDEEPTPPEQNPQAGS